VSLLLAIIILFIHSYCITNSIIYEIDIGLTPVISTPNKKNKKKIVTMEQQSQSQLKSLHSITTNTQLQYTRNGHAALRSIIPTQILKSIKNELKLYSTTKEIEAWKQKVEVAVSTAKSNSDMDTNAVMDIDKILESCTSVSKCKTLLKQYNNDNDEIIIPFLQHFNTWQSTKMCPTVHDLVTSPFLSNMAKQLLDVPTVKLYQDSLFHKRYDDGPTPWHSDARMAPFDTSNMITFWIPLDYIPDVEDGGTGLWFVDKSHSDFALPFWNPIPKCDDDDDYDDDDERNDIYARLEERYGGEDNVKHYMPLELGDCTVHSGWTLHCANGMTMFDNEDDNDEQNLFLKKDRYALAVTYVDGRAEIRNDIQQNKNSLGHDEDRQSYVKWIDDVEPRQCFEHPLVPTVWPQ
jgi:ectoine hydroxylase-related dioxygenase (phytanoyl-CoA dioxygenase family)